MDGAVSLARRLRVADFVIGLVIVGIGTSIPEFAVSFLANLSGRGDISLGTIIGSNTFNILFILGISALFFPLRFRSQWVDRDLIWNVIAIFVVGLAALPFGDGVISRGEGIILLLIFLLWLYIVIRYTKEKPAVSGEQAKIVALPLTIVLIIAGFLGVILGGKWVVDGAAAVARDIGISERFIGLTIVGIGTSLPELAATFVAALKREAGIAVGNIIGSNIFDFLMILGFGAITQPIVFSVTLGADIIVTLLSAILLYGLLYFGERLLLERWQGLLMTALYFVYLIYLLSHG